MANVKQSVKAIRKTRSRSAKNQHDRTRLKTLDKKVQDAAKNNAEQYEPAREEFFSALDKAAKAKVIHRNKANRLKSKAARLQPTA